jgi:hypothetical protein
MDGQQNDQKPDPLASLGVPATGSSSAADPLAGIGVPADASSSSAGAPTQTMFNTPASPEVKQEVSGAGDFLRGDISTGLGKIWDAEKPHVIQGSPLEQMIQTVLPDFKGAVTKDEVSQHNANYNPMDRPPVDVASGIDKQQHPVKKAIAEFAQSALTPNNVALLYATGGAGLVESPAALSMAHRLLSAGFSAMAIGQAYKNLSSFKAAYDKGDESDALYQLTHAVTSGALAVVAAKSVATGEPVVSKETVGKATAAASSAVDAIKANNPFRGKAVAQAPAETAIRQGVQTAATEGGAADDTVAGTASAPLLQGNATILDEPLQDLAVTEKKMYQNTDKTAGFDLKAEKEQLKNDQYKIKQLGNTEADATQRVKLQEAITDSTARIADAEQRLKDAGIDPKAADAMHTRRMAGEDFKKILVKAVSPDGTINIDQLLRASKNLRFAKRGDRLAQFMGDDGADTYMTQLEAAQKSGLHAAKVQNIAKWVGGIVAGTIGLGALKEGASVVLGQ